MSVLVLAGTIGAGKSSLTEMLAKELGTEAFYESVDDNKVLPLFYKDPRKYAFLLQIYFLNKRFDSIKQALSNNNNVLDRSIYEDSAKKVISVLDDGDGMSFEEIQEKFLRIGRHRREEGEERHNSLGRKITGKKGLGKLALFGIGKHISIITTRAEDDTAIKFELDWDEILTSDAIYFPTFENIKKEFPKGTKITLSELTRISDFDASKTALSLSKMFNCFDEEFSVSVQRNDEPKIELTREMRFSDLEIQKVWDVASLVNEIDSEFQNQHNLTGKIQSSLKPTRQDLRGITLYANGRLINEQGFFDVPEAGHAFSYLSGWVDADYIDEFSEDFIATDRHSLSWDLEEPQKLKEILKKIIRKIVNEWSTMRREENKKKVDAVAAKSDINLEQWKSTLDSNIVIPLEKVINDLVKNEIESIDEEDSTFKKTIDSLHKLVPEYAQFHFRYMHPVLQKECKEYYQNANYYNAVQQACIAYAFAVKDKVEEFGQSRPTETDRSLMGKYFGPEKLIRVASTSTKANGRPLEVDTKKGLEEAQTLLSQGVIAGFRNPIAHEGDNLKDGIISEKHCLDALSLISMLFERLEKSEKSI